MLREGVFFLAFTVLSFLSFTDIVQAQYDYEVGYSRSRDSEHRNAADADDWIERGRASVTNSPMFSDGIRLTADAAEGEQEFEPGLASAIYRFVVPSWTNYLKISVRYKDVSKDDEVAGRLWVKTTDKESRGKLASEEEAPLHGDTFILRSDRTSETINVPSGRHVENKELEIHVVTEGRDCLDVKSIQVGYLRKQPTRIKIVTRSYDDYWHVWPPHWYAYHYYYWGPYYWPGPFGVYVRWVLPWDYYWNVFRPWFRISVRVHYTRYPHWYRRYSVIYACNPHDPVVKRRLEFRRRLKTRRPKVLVSPHRVVTKHKVLRRPVKPKSRSVIFSYGGTKRINKKGPEQLRSRTAPQASRSKEMVRETSQVRKVRTQETRPKKQIKASPRLEENVGRGSPRSQVKKRPVPAVEKRQREVMANPRTVVKKQEMLPRSVKPKSRATGSSHSPAKQVRRERQEQVQSLRPQRTSRSKVVVRETSRSRVVRTREARPEKQIRRQSEIRREIRSQRHPAIWRSGSDAAKRRSLLR